MPFKPKIMYASCLHQTCWPRIQWGSVIREHLKSGLSNDQALTVAIAIAPAIWNLDIFVWISNGFWQNGGHLSGFQMVGLPNFRSHLKSRKSVWILNVQVFKWLGNIAKAWPIENRAIEIQPSKGPDFQCFQILNGQISDPHCFYILSQVFVEKCQSKTKIEF